MPKPQIMICAIALGCIFTFVAFGQEANFNVKTGLWENTITTQSNGMPPIPDDMLARMTPEQRAKFDAAMKASMARGGHPHTYKYCLTKEKLAQGFNPEDTERHNCKRTVLTNSPKVMEIKEECSEQGGTMLLTVHFEANGSDATTGKTHIVLSKADRTMTSDGTMTGKWLGPDCGDVK